jgi:hypothetical protein
MGAFPYSPHQRMCREMFEILIFDAFITLSNFTFGGTLTEEVDQFLGGQTGH